MYKLHFFKTLFEYNFGKNPIDKNADFRHS